MAYEDSPEPSVDPGLLETELVQYDAIWKRFMDDVDATREPTEPRVFTDIPSVRGGATREQHEAFAKEVADGQGLPEGLPAAGGIYKWEGLLYYCMRDLGYPVKLLSRSWQVKRKDGGMSTVGISHGFDVEVAPEAVELARRCFATDTPEILALKLAMDPPRDILTAVRDLTNEVEENEGRFAGSRFIGRAVVSAMLKISWTQLELPSFNESAELEKARLKYYYAVFRNHHAKPLGPEEMCGLASSHIKQVAAQQ